MMFSRVLFIAFTLCFTLYAQPKKVTLQLSWKNQFQFAGYLIAKHNGLYKNAGLDVTIQEYDHGVSLVDDTLNEKADFCIGRSSILIDKLEGKAIVALAAVFQSSPMVLVTLRSSGISDVHQLKNSRIMVTDDAKESANINAMLRANGIDKQDFIAQPHTFNIQDLVKGKTDAMASYISNEPYYLQSHDIAYHILSPQQYGFDFYDDFLFTSKSLIEKDFELVKAFHKASMDGWNIAFQDIEQTAKIIHTHFNTQNKTLDALIYEGKELKKLAYTNNNDLGIIKKSKIEKILNTYFVLGIKNSKIDTDAFFASFTNPKINEYYKNDENFIIHYMFVDNYELIAKILAGVLIIIGMILYSNRKLKNEIQKRKQIESELLQAKDEAQKANLSKSNFVAQMSHEIKTPMNLIVGYCELLKKTPLEDKQSEYCTMILAGSNSLLSIVDEILELSQIEYNKLTLHTSNVDLETMVSQWHNIFNFFAKSKGIELHIKLLKNTPKWVITDAKKLDRIVCNLLSNAIKYTHSNGSVTLDISHQTSKTHTILALKVIDSGIGIQEEDKKNIFELFCRGSVVENQKGYGLGLYIVREYINFLDWKIDFQSSFGKGSSFHVTTNELKICSNDVIQTNFETVQPELLLDEVNILEPSLITIINELLNVFDLNQAQYLVTRIKVSPNINKNLQTWLEQYETALQNFDIHTINICLKILQKSLEIKNV